ncbi:MAG: PorT family protein [Tannerella sp.]|jgi:hypothetical protein|nr:PorT family protein [Tannerella sp.]
MEKKKWLLLMAFVILMAPVANAQFRFGVKGGVNIAKVSFSKDVISPDNVTGFHIGPTIEIGGDGLGVDAAVLYSQKGFEYDNESIKNDYIDVPVNLKYKFSMVPIVKPYVAAGPYFSFRVAGDKVWDTIKGQIESKSFDTGLNLGIGAEVLRLLQVGVTYSWGFTDNYDFEVDDSSGKNRMWSISAAVYF